ncbi:coiled-coil domain-containing protein 3 isoform 2-T3 [Lycodopsis pacificus]
MWIILAFILAAAGPDGSWGCQLPRDWRQQTEACRAELAQIIVFAKVLALHKEFYNVYDNYLPVQPSDTELLFSAEIELLCDQAWGSMLEVPAGSRFNVTGLGYFTCFSYSVTKNNNYYFFLRMDENYNIIPHGVNFQDPIFPDTAENHRTFASLFQFANCTSGTQIHTYAPEWEAQEDSRVFPLRLDRLAPPPPPPAGVRLELRCIPNQIRGEMVSPVPPRGFKLESRWG